MNIQVGLGGAENFNQAGTGIHAIVKTKPALFEKDMAAKLAAQQGAGFLHFGLHIGVAGLPHNGAAAVVADQGVEVAGRFHVKQHVGARVA